ncbi:MAG: inositol monophosphatase family protein, partial [Ilumatobacteraceae bacterium]
MNNAELFASWSTLNDAQLSVELARVAGQLLVEHRETTIKSGTTQWQLKDSGDLLAHNFLMEAFAAVRPFDAVLSEEGSDDRRRLSSDRVWIVDPLDGTNEYGEGRSDWAVHIALWENNALTAGAVSLPSIHAVFGTDPAVVVPEKV